MSAVLPGSRRGTRGVSFNASVADTILATPSLIEAGGSNHVQPVSAQSNRSVHDVQPGPSSPKPSTLVQSSIIKITGVSDISILSPSTQPQVDIHSMHTFYLMEIVAHLTCRRCVVVEMQASSFLPKARNSGRGVSFAADAGILNESVDNDSTTPVVSRRPRLSLVNLAHGIPLSIPARARSPPPAITATSPSEDATLDLVDSGPIFNAMPQWPTLRLKSLQPLVPLVSAMKPHSTRSASFTQMIRVPSPRHDETDVIMPVISVTLPQKRRKAARGVTFSSASTVSGDDVLSITPLVVPPTKRAHSPPPAALGD